MTATICTLFNQKGGVGKTTTTYFLADAANARGFKTLIIDTDPQGNLTSATTKEELPDTYAGLADVLTHHSDIDLPDVVTPTTWENVDLIPAGPSRFLALVRDELIITTTGRETRLKKSLKQLKDQYDLILIDCPPSIDMLTVNALVASNSLVVVTEAAKWSIDGIAELLTTVEAVQDNYNEDLKISGLVINLYDKTTNKSRYWLNQVETGSKQLGLSMYYPPVPKAVRLSKLTESAHSLQATADDPIAKIYANYLTKLLGA